MTLVYSSALLGQEVAKGATLDQLNIRPGDQILDRRATQDKLGGHRHVDWSNGWTHQHNSCAFATMSNGGTEGAAKVWSIPQAIEQPTVERSPNRRRSGGTRIVAPASDSAIGIEIARRADRRIAPAARTVTVRRPVRDRESSRERRARLSRPHRAVARDPAGGDRREALVARPRRLFADARRTRSSRAVHRCAVQQAQAGSRRHALHDLQVPHDARGRRAQLGRRVGHQERSARDPARPHASSHASWTSCRSS